MSLFTAGCASRSGDPPPSSLGSRNVSDTPSDYAGQVTTTPPMATPRIAAGVLFRDPDGRVLLVKPTYKAGWDIPGGYVEPGESPKQAALREVREELGIE